MKAVLAAQGTLGLPLALVAMLAMDAGLPLPIPTDLLLLLIGERAAAGVFPVWAAAIGLEVVAIGGSTLLFVAARGPAAYLIQRLGPRIGLTAARVEAGARVVKRGGRGSLTVGRATPGLRTATVLAAAAAGLKPAYALPPLILGGSIFLQGWFYLGAAGFLGALAAWGICEPAVIDGQGHRWGNIVLLPMVSSLEEVREVHRIFDEVRRQLIEQGYEVASDVAVGIMLEVPSSEPER